MPDEIEMPANCSECGGVWDLNAMYSTRSCGVICPPCKRDLDVSSSEGEPT